MDKSEVPTVAEIAAGLIPHLNAGGVKDKWAVESAEDSRARISRPDGAAFVLWGSRFDARVEVTGCYPPDGNRHMSARDWGALPYNAKQPGITFGRGRPLDKVAADLTRRFLTEYIPLFASCREKKAATGDWRTRRDNVAERLAEALDAEVRRAAHAGPDGTPRVYLHGVGEFEVNGDNSVKVTLSVTGEFALKLARWIQDNS
jgi:hypothetical protein